MDRQASIRVPPSLMCWRICWPYCCSSRSSMSSRTLPAGRSPPDQAGGLARPAPTARNTAASDHPAAKHRPPQIHAQQTHPASARAIAKTSLPKNEPTILAPMREGGDLPCSVSSGPIGMPVDLWTGLALPTTPQAHPPLLVRLFLCMVPGPLVAHHGVERDQEFAHDGGERDLSGPVIGGGGEAFVEVAHDRVPADRGACGVEQHAAHAGPAVAGDGAGPGFAAVAGVRRETDQGGDLL